MGEKYLALGYLYAVMILSPEVSPGFAEKPVNTE
jgi:hypothetical protein